MPEATQHEASYEQLVAKYKEVYTITGTDATGKVLTGYYRKADYETRKLCFQIAYKNSTDILSIGEVLLNKCYIGGDHLATIEDAKLEAAIQAAEMMQFNESFQIKKN